MATNRRNTTIPNNVKKTPTTSLGMYSAVFVMLITASFFMFHTENVNVTRTVSLRYIKKHISNKLDEKSDLYHNSTMNHRFSHESLLPKSYNLQTLIKAISVLNDTKIQNQATISTLTQKIKMLENTSLFKYSINNNKSAENHDHDVDIVSDRKQMPQTKMVEKIKHM